MATDSPPQHWHVRKELHAGHLLTTLAIIVAIFQAWGNMDKRVTIVEKTQERQEVVNTKIEGHLRNIDAGMQELLAELRYMQGKNGH